MSHVEQCPASAVARGTVILIPGLLRTGASMNIMAERIAGSGYRVSRVQYRRNETPAVIEARIGALVRGIEGPIYVIGHSYGGVLAVGACRHPHAAGRVHGVLCLGSPIRGCRTAAALRRYRVGRALLGVAGGYLVGGLSYPHITVPVAMIAGERAHGVGSLIGALTGMNDGVVSVAETAWPGLREHIRLPISHRHLVTDALATRHALAFLSTGSLLGRVATPRQGRADGHAATRH